MYLLLGQTKLEHEFEQKFWDFDDKLIDIAQYFHLQHDKPVRKIVGGFISLLAFVASGMLQ